MPGVVIFDPEDDNIGLSTGDDQAVGVHLDIETNSLYLTDLDNIIQWEGSANNMTYTWKSGQVRLPRPVNMGAAVVEADTYNNITFKLSALIDNIDTLITSIPITSSEPVRLPGGYTSNIFTVELIGTDRVSTVAVGQSVFDLASI